MANFSVPKFEGVQQAGQQYADTLTRVAMMKREERLRAEDDRTRALLGASTGDIAVFVPEAREQLAAARSSEERADILARAAQLATARSLQQSELFNKAKAIGDSVAASGTSDPAALAEHQNALVTSGLPPDIIAQIQSQLGTSATMGSAEFGKVKGERDYRKTERLEDRAYDRTEFDRRTAIGERKQIESEGRMSAREIERENRAAVQGDLEARRTYAIKLGVPWSNKKPAEWPEINAATLYSLENEGKPQPKEIRAANRQVVEAVMFENKSKPRGGDVTDATVMGRARDLNTQAATTGSDLVVMPVVTRDSGVFNWQEDVRLEAMTWQDARVELARVYKIAQTEGEGSEAAKYVAHVVSLASTTDSPALKSMLSRQVTPEQAAAIEAGKAAKPATAEPAAGKPVTARDTGRSIGSAVRRGAKSVAKSLTPSAAGAERAARSVGESQRKQGEIARQSNRRLKEGLVGAYEGLLGDE